MTKKMVTLTLTITVLQSTSVGQYCNIHIFLSFLDSLLKQCIFSKFSRSSPSPTLYKVETLKKFWIHMSNIVCGVRGGAGPVWIGKRPRNTKVFQTFVHDCSFQDDTNNNKFAIWYYAIVHTLLRQPFPNSCFFFFLILVHLSWFPSSSLSF